MCADAVDIGKPIHPHPTPGESIGMAAEVTYVGCMGAVDAEVDPSTVSTPA